MHDACHDSQTSTYKMQRTVVTVEYTDGSSAQLPASIVATDAQHDLAVLRIDAAPDLVQPIKVMLIIPAPYSAQANQGRVRLGSELQHITDLAQSCQQIWCMHCSDVLVSHLDRGSCVCRWAAPKA